MVLLSACFASPRYSPGVHYFSWVNLYVEPPIPTEPISKEKADALMAQGYAISVGEYDRNGQLMTLKKIYKGQTTLEWTASRSDAALLSR